MTPRNLAGVGLAFVALSAATALGVIWRVGARVEKQLADFGAALPAATQFVLEGRVGLSVLVIVVFAVAIFLHRHPRAVVALVLLGLLELSIVGVFGLALWLPYRPPSGGAIR